MLLLKSLSNFLIFLLFFTLFKSNSTHDELNEKKVQGIENRTKVPETCNQSMNVGLCIGRFPSFYYDFARGECLPFDYTGCDGNSNRFHTKEQCERLCLRREPSIPIRIGLNGAGRVDTVPHHPLIQQREQAQEKHICEHPKDTGPCNRYVTKWFYNKADGTCNRFHYGGCEGNSNRFENEQQCKQTCGEYIDTCYLPKVVGPCAGKYKRYFYSQSTKQCTEFEYSGCLGNNNNFKTLEECESRCGGNGSPQNPNVETTTYIVPTEVISTTTQTKVNSNYECPIWTHITVIASEEVTYILDGSYVYKIQNQLVVKKGSIADFFIQWDYSSSIDAGYIRNGSLILLDFTCQDLIPCQKQVHIYDPIPMQPDKFKLRKDFSKKLPIDMIIYGAIMINDKAYIFGYDITSDHLRFQPHYLIYDERFNNVTTKMELKFNFPNFPIKHPLFFHGGHTTSFNGQKLLTLFTHKYIFSAVKPLVQVYTYDLERKNLVGGGKNLNEYLLNCH